MTTENNVAAQAGDEPMRAVVALACKWHNEAVMAGFSGSKESQDLFDLLGWPKLNSAGSTQRDVDTVPMPKNALQAEGMMKLGLAWLQHNAPERLTEAGRVVSLRATADVERDKAVCDLVRLWESESVSADDYNEEMCRIEAIIRATTKPGA